MLNYYQKCLRHSSMTLNKNLMASSSLMMGEEHLVNERGQKRTNRQQIFSSLCLMKI